MTNVLILLLMTSVLWEFASTENALLFRIQLVLIFAMEHLANVATAFLTMGNSAMTAIPLPATVATRSAKLNRTSVFIRSHASMFRARFWAGHQSRP